MKEDFFTIWNPVTFLPSPMCIWRHRAGCLAWSCLRWHHVCQIWFIRPWDHANSRNRNIYHWFSVEHSLLTSMWRNLIIGCRIICKGMDQLPATVRRFILSFFNSFPKSSISDFLPRTNSQRLKYFFLDTLVSAFRLFKPLVDLSVRFWTFFHFWITVQCTGIVYDVGLLTLILGVMKWHFSLLVFSQE